MTSDCIFCNICTHTHPADILYEDEEILIFKDIKPVAKYHYLAIPKQHIKNVKCLTKEHKPLIDKLVNCGKNILQENGANLEDLLMGFHVPPFNSINHLHVHLITPASEAGLWGRLAFRPNTWWFASVDFIVNNLPSAASSNKL